MALFNFIKTAGMAVKAMREKFDGDDEKEQAEKQAAKEIAEQADNLGLGGDYRVLVEGETVKLKGKVPDQETLEKVILAAGNVEGVAAVDTSEIEAEDDKDVSAFYTVEKGDTLSKIAKEYLGDAMRYPEIFEANRPMLSDPDKIYPGQVLRIPGGKAQA